MFKMCGDINAWQRATKKKCCACRICDFLFFFFCMAVVHGGIYKMVIYKKEAHVFRPLSKIFDGKFFYENK